MDANSGLTVDSTSTEVTYLVLSEADNWTGSPEFHPRSLSGNFDTVSEAQDMADKLNADEMFRWTARVVVRQTRKVVTYSEV